MLEEFAQISTYMIFIFDKIRQSSSLNPRLESRYAEAQ